MDSLRLPKWATNESSKRRALIHSSGMMNMAKKGINATLRHRISPEMRPQHPLSVKGVKPGELYCVGMSMKRRGGGYAYNNVRFRGNGTNVVSRTQTIAMRQPRRDDVWRSGEVVVRVPEGADEIYFDVRAEVNAKTGYYEYKDFTVYKIGEPLPVWPAESLREGTYWKK
jgi:hypothetical protein